MSMVVGGSATLFPRQSTAHAASPRRPCGAHELGVSSGCQESEPLERARGSPRTGTANGRARRVRGPRGDSTAIEHGRKVKSRRKNGSNSREGFLRGASREGKVYPQMVSHGSLLSAGRVGPAGEHSGEKHKMKRRGAGRIDEDAGGWLSGVPRREPTNPPGPLSARGEACPRASLNLSAPRR